AGATALSEDVNGSSTAATKANDRCPGGHTLRIEALPTPYLPLRRTLGFKEDCKTLKRPVKRGCLFTGLLSYVVVFCFYVGGNLLSHTLPGAVPSARAGLASGFGMGNRAFPCRYRHRQIIGTNMF